eukprot:3396279-Prymnesium_polylepis.1
MRPQPRYCAKPPETACVPSAMGAPQTWISLKTNKYSTEPSTHMRVVESRTQDGVAAADRGEGGGDVVVRFAEPDDGGGGRRGEWDGGGIRANAAANGPRVAKGRGVACGDGGDI